MKALFQKSALALALAGGIQTTTIESAAAFVRNEQRVVVRDGIIPARPVQPRFGRGPVRDTMYRWYDPYGYNYGYYPPRYYPGIYWGGYNIYSRPIYVGAYASCGWARIATPWGPRWRPVCY